MGLEFKQQLDELFHGVLYLFLARKLVSCYFLGSLLMVYSSEENKDHTVISVFNFAYSFPEQGVLDSIGY